MTVAAAYDSDGMNSIRRVFGQVVVEDVLTDVSGSSLCYSPSPTVERTDDRNADAVDPKTITFGDKENTHPIAQTNTIERQAKVRTPVVSKPSKPVRETKQQMKERLRSKSKRRDLVKKTQEAVTTASISVNQSLNAVRKAREMDFHERSNQTAKVRNQWKEEKEEAMQFYAAAEKNRQELLALQRQLTSKFQKAKAQKQQANRSKKFDNITKESNFKSEVYRKHQETLKEERDRKRRESIDARTKLRQNHRDGDERLQMMRIHEDEALADERYAASQATTTYRRDYAKKRRDSFQFRSGDARRIKALHAQMRSDQLELQHKSYQLKFEGERDADAYRRKLEEGRRNSFAFRVKEGRKQRNKMAEMEAQEKCHEHESYEHKWNGERDAEKYKRQMDEERRKSLALRNKTAKAQRDEQAKRDDEAFQKEHLSYEMKWDGEKDAEAYHRKLAKEHRESLHFRNKESLRHAKVMDELRSLAFQKEHEWHMAMLADHRDVKAYIANCEKERRESLAFRNKEGKRHRDLEEEWHTQEVAAAHEDEELRAAGHRDTQEYRKKCEERDRKSLQFRGKHKQLQRLEEKKQKLEEYELDQANQKIEDGAWNDVNEYVRDCKNRRRMSLATRAKEKRRHAEWRKKQDELRIDQQIQDGKLRSMDARSQEMAKREERAKIAMNAIRHMGCSFNGNPFSFILD